MTQKERQERSRREIFQAAMEEFGANDYGQVTMEAICTRHGISKGMMYHYYSNKDELFLLCVEDTMAALRAYLERQCAELAQRPPVEAMREFFLCRERFFDGQPGRKRVFENALLRPPKQLASRIQEMRRPIRELNWWFLEEMVGRMELRPGMDKEKAGRYLESLEDVFFSVVTQYRAQGKPEDVHSLLETAGEVLEMVLFGVVRQAR